MQDVSRFKDYSYLKRVWYIAIFQNTDGILGYTQIHGYICKALGYDTGQEVVGHHV